MIWSPKKGEIARVHHRKSLAPDMPLHGCIVTVEAVATGRGPRNVLVSVDRTDVDEWISAGTITRAVVPRGNLARVFFDPDSGFST